MREKAYGNDLSLLWNTLMPLEANVVTKEEAVYFYSFDMNELRDIEQMFDLFIQGPFLSSGSEKQNEVLKAISRLLQVIGKFWMTFLLMTLVLLPLLLKTITFSCNMFSLFYLSIFCLRKNQQLATGLIKPFILIQKHSTS